MKLNLKYSKDKILLFNNDCFDVIKSMINSNKKIDCVLTSPPYNTGRQSVSERSRNNYESRYDIYIDNKTEEEYSKWTCDLFNNFNSILNENGVILYNISYGNENPNVLWLTMADIIRNTDFMIADVVVWKKKSALPNNVSHNKLTRIIEYVFVICRKSEYITYKTNKQIKNKGKNGQNYYENIFNYVEAKNNDGACSLNKATYSSELCEKLLDIYVREGSIVFDPFIGTGTTAVACINKGLKCIGVELSGQQTQFAVDRLKKLKGEKK